ncbi:M23 family metallopeptidase [Inmirania thermothiophila]|uniref:Peptidase M23-like protein n=1 Tax=Inmirania thermothiophila TaxID=1750597 RepID=A0A3N1XSR7_9GAMM|nr:M23 family metallopeptidase [Inmirania thermothiophila]ROR29693.1 peptidase M23-like protein [Inmirania thermothiophila]
MRLFLLKGPRRARIVPAGGAIAGAAAVVVLLAAGAFAVGYRAGAAGMRPRVDAIQARLEEELAARRREVEAARRHAEDSVDALAARLGELQARLMRLEAVGARITELADLDPSEFDFDQPPGRGGPEADVAPATAVPDFVRALDELAQALEAREQQLEAVQDLLVTRSVREEVLPAGRPVRSGWLSSRFGRRADPFTGRPEWHQGVDFAGRFGSDVIAVASGVVTWAGPRYGYGNLVEIDHGNGYVTRYGHNSELLVKVGDLVRKGQVIAKMGSSGRSTGPHVHLEVLRDGRPVDPLRYVRAARR